MNANTWTIPHVVVGRVDKLVDVEVTRTRLDLNVEPIEAAVIPIIRAHLAGDHTLFDLWVSAAEPQGVISTTSVHIHTAFRHPDAHALVEETVPAVPVKVVIASGQSWLVTASPWLVQRSVAVAGIMGNCNKEEAAFTRLQQPLQLQFTSPQQAVKSHVTRVWVE